MDKKKLKTFSIVYGIAYLVILLFPVLTIVPIDYLLEFIYDTRYVGGWTKGTMVYFSLIVIIPLLYVAVIVSYYYSKKRK
jgi:uncharacterized BrkB/YihY/UPF0761 family membrane protein